MYKDYLDVNPEVAKALSEGLPVVALESTIIAVSYTHLDVYKRQPYNTIVQEQERRLETFEIFDSEGNFNKESFKNSIDEILTVSYTHLIGCPCGIFHFAGSLYLFRFQLEENLMGALVGKGKSCLLYTSRCV